MNHKLRAAYDSPSITKNSSIRNGLIELIQRINNKRAVRKVLKRKLERKNTMAG